jgi:hypothetical protein
VSMLGEVQHRRVEPKLLQVAGGGRREGVHLLAARQAACIISLLLSCLVSDGAGLIVRECTY